MRPLHTNKKRATRADALRARKTGVLGGMSASDYLSNAERQKLAHAAVSALEDVIKRQFPRTQNLEYAVLKAHLILEFAITEFIRCKASVLVDHDKINFTFAQKLDIAVLNGFGGVHLMTIPSIEILNQLRNQVAHRFLFDKQLLNELILLNTEDIDPRKLTDRQRISYLRIFCAEMCGIIAGDILASIALT